MKKKPLIIIAGPTASGKTKTSVLLAKAINGEIISADSMQVYRGMNIGTAKATIEEMQGVPHHMIDVLSPDEPCSIAKFQKLVKVALADIYSRGKVPILTGGTGFYIQSIVNDIAFEENEGDKSYRAGLEKMVKDGGGDSLFLKLKTIDPDAADMIHPNNMKRVIRALEYVHLTGERISVHNEREKLKTSPYDVGFYVLTMDRDYLYQRIDERVDKMLEEGLLTEVKKLLEQGYSKDLVSMQGLGYKEIIRYLSGEWTLAQSVEILKRDTRRFAKRQLTWFRREKSATWVNLTQYSYNIEEIVNFITKDIEESKIL